MSTAHQPTQSYSPGEYLALERRAEQKHEFNGGRIVAMAGANARHNLICSSLTAAAVPLVRRHGCKFFGSDMKVWVHQTGLYTYPDASIACGVAEYQDQHEDVLLNPCVLIEVLSKSTASRDRGWKFQNYWKIPSLVDYVLVSQDKPLVEHYVRRPDGNWMFEFVEGLEGTLQLTAVDCQLPLADIYLD
ncbi:MAG: Uma2 family endonuclease, partial [Pirellulaceae bacterium]